MKPIRRSLILIITCVALSFPVTLTTYFYQYYPQDGWWWGGWGSSGRIYKGWPLPWVVERSDNALFLPIENCEALNFSLDFVFWTMLLLLLSSLYLYLREPAKAERQSTRLTKQF